MSKTGSFLFISCLLLWCSACSWVDDDRSGCPTGCWVKLSYTYNMLDVDAVTTQVTDASIFVFDTNGICIAREEADSLSRRHGNHMVKLPALPEGDYDILVWAGLADNHYQYMDTSLLLSRSETGEQPDKLAALFHGRTDGEHIDENYRVIDIPLIKDTNLFSCVLQSQTGNALESENFDMEISASNGRMDHHNLPIGNDMVVYKPFFIENTALENISVIHAGLNVLRLMENDDTRFRLHHRPSGKTIIDIPLTQYLLLTRHAKTFKMSPQEYLDRQDQYNLIFFLTASEKPEDPFLCQQMMVNGWMIRLNEAELEE